jgi:FkbM family methyltransferase
LIRVSLRVSSGIVGVGCLTVGETQFIDEILVSATPTPATAEVVVRNPREAGPLVVRNASSSGVSEANLLNLECFALDVQPELARAPGLSDPRPCPQWSRYYGAHGGTVRERLLLQSFESLVEPLIVRWVDGLSLPVLPGDQLSRALYVSGTYEPNTLSVLRRLLKVGHTFIDVGANTGVMSLVASKWVGAAGQVYSFEPSQREYEKLLGNIERNTAANVRPFRLAVTSSSGVANLRVAPESYAGLNTLGSEFPYAGVETLRLEPVETTTLDDFVKAHGIDRVDAVKLDVEGAEAAALQGAHRLLVDQRPALVLEIFSRSLRANGSSAPAVERLLRAARYRLFSIDDSTARLERIAGLADIDEQNIVALPAERSDSLL